MSDSEAGQQTGAQKSERRPRLVYVTTYDPAQMSNGGAAWVDQRVIADLSAAYQIHVFAICEPGGVPLEIRGSLARQVWTLARMVATNEPLHSAKFMHSPAWGRRRQRLAQAIRTADIVVSSQWPAALMLDQVGRVPDLHITHNADHVLAEQTDSRLLRSLQDGKRTRRDEARILGALPTVLALSTTDAKRLAMMGISATPLDLAPRHRPRPRKVIDDRFRVGFLGKASWPPNATALQLLQREVLPALSQHLRLPPQLIVAGRGTEEVTGEGVKVLGAISDVREFYGQVDAVVVPRLGLSTGVSVKLLEAIEFGVPAVAPSQLVNDAGLQHGVVVADSAEEIIAALADIAAVDDPIHRSPRDTSPNQSAPRQTALSALRDGAA